MNFSNTSYLLLTIFPIICSQYYATGDESRGLHNRRKGPNNNSGVPCGRQIQNNAENAKFLGLAYITVENTVNCGHYTNTNGGGGLHKPHRPFQNQNHDNGAQSGYVGGGLFGNKPHRPFAGLVTGLFANGGQNEQGAGAGDAFGGLVSSVVSNVGTFVSNSNPFQNGFNPFQGTSQVEDVLNDPVSVHEQDKLPFFSNYLFQKPQHELTQNNNENSGLFFGLFDGSIINGYLNNKPGHNQQNNNDRPTNRPTTTKKPDYDINNHFVPTEMSPRPIYSAENINKPVHEDYDLVTELYSLQINRPVVVQMNPYANLRPGQYISAYNPINPNKIYKQINKSVNKFLDLLL